jgi:hypothetical protein
MERKIYKLLSGAQRVLFAFVSLVFINTAHSQTYTISFTGSSQTFVVPTNGNYRIECWGADGGGISTFGGGGVGGYSAGDYYFANAGTVLNIFVGGKGNPGSGNSSTAGSGGWNGGGGGSAVGYSGAGGGGATDVRFGGNGAPNRIIVAGGGGGAAYYGGSLVSTSVALGGNGGAQLGQNGNSINSAGLITIGGGGAGANGGSPGLATVLTSNGTSIGGGGGGISAGSSVGQPGTGGGEGGAAGPSASGSTGSAGGGGGGYAGGAGGVQTANGGFAGGGGSGYVGGVSNGTTVAFGQTGFMPNPDVLGRGIVVITKLCSISIFAAQNPICVGNTISLSSDALSGVTWDSGLTTPAVNVSPSVTTTYSMTGTSTVVVNASTVSCIANSFITVTVNPLPVLSIVPFPTVACVGRPSYLTGYGALSPTSYSWSNGMNAVQVATVNPVANTVYTLTGINNFGCTNTQTILLTMNTNTLTVIQSATAICEGQSANLTASGAVTYTWSNGLMYQTIPVTPTVTTNYSVTATDANNCTISNFLSLTVLSKPTVSITSNKTSLCRGEQITLTGAGANTYTWNTNAQTPSLVFTVPSDIIYYFNVTGKDANGCTNVASYSIAVSRCVGIKESEASDAAFNLYPNPGTGLFDLYVSQVNEHLEVQVFNELGMLVKSQTVVSTENKLDLQNETRGIYFVRIIDNKNVVKVIKLIKE